MSDGPNPDVPPTEVGGTPSERKSDAFPVQTGQRQLAGVIGATHRGLEPPRLIADGIGKQRHLDSMPRRTTGDGASLTKESGRVHGNRTRRPLPPTRRVPGPLDLSSRQAVRTMKRQA